MTKYPLKLETLIERIDRADKEINLARYEEERKKWKSIRSFLGKQYFNIVGEWYERSKIK